MVALGSLPPGFYFSFTTNGYIYQVVSHYYDEEEGTHYTVYRTPQGVQYEAWDGTFVHFQGD